MVTFELTYRGKHPQQISFLHEWDLPPGARVIRNHTRVTATDVGKYIAFNDGSKLYTKITKVRRKWFVTETGLYRKRDLVLMAIPKRRRTNYAGVYQYDEHKYVKGFQYWEYYRAKELLRGDIPENYYAQRNRYKGRIRLAAKEIAEKTLKDLNIDVKTVVTEFAILAKKDGPHKFNSLKVISHLLGLEVEPKRYAVPPPPPQPLFANFTEVNVINDRGKKQIDAEDGEIIRDSPAQIENDITYNDIPKNHIPSLANIKKLAKYNRNKQTNEKAKIMTDE